MEQNPMHHSRIYEVLQDYWQKMRHGESFPRENEIDPDALKEIWGSCFLVSARMDGSFAYNYLGDSLVEAYGDDLTGKEIAETLLNPHPQSLYNSFQQVAKDGTPRFDDGEFVNSQGTLIKYRSCVFPLAGNHDERVGFLLGGMKWKAY